MIMEENTQLPKEVVDQIEKQAEAHNARLKEHAESGKDEAYAQGFAEGWHEGATAYATKLHQANETIKVLTYDNNKLKGEVEGYKSAVEELKRWKSEAMILLSKIDNYADKHPELKLGMGKVEFTIDRAKKYDRALKVQASWRPLLEAVLNDWNSSALKPELRDKIRKFLYGE